MLDLSISQIHQSSVNKNKMEVVSSKVEQKNEASQSKQEQQYQYDYKHIITVFVLIAYQVGIGVMYGLLFQIPSSSTPITSLKDPFYVSLILLLSIVGFGLIFGYYHRLGWTAIGFNLFIAALSIQTYFVANLLFTKSGILTQQITFQDQQRYKIYFALNSTNKYEGTMMEAAKCALSCIIAFSCVIGRVGILETFFIATFGTFGYEASRQFGFVTNDHELGTFKIFGYGAGIGLSISLLLKCYEIPLKDHQKFKSTPQSQIFTLIGMCFYFFIFPLLVDDHVRNLYTIYQIVAILLSISIATVAGIVFSLFYGGFLTLITCSLAGGIAVLSSVPYIRQPSLAFIIGGGSAIVQYIVYLLDKCLTKRFGHIDPFRFVFIVQGIFGSLWALMAKAFYFQDHDPSIYSPGIQLFLAGLKSIGIGLGVGIILGIIFDIILYNQEYKEDYYFEDHTFWKSGDGIKSEQAKDQDLSSEDDIQHKVIKQYQFKEYSRFKQTHSIL